MPETIDGIVGTMGGDVIEYIRKVAPTDANVLIAGETGTGKELVARAIHRFSGRRDSPFVAVNCTAIQPTLVESELFGSVHGAYTGALRDRAGLFEGAGDGTIFLDEIGDMDVESQRKILRALEQREFYRVGSAASSTFNVRIVAATCKNLPGGKEDGTLIDALFYRLNEFGISIPPLRERPGDIRPLVYHFVKLFLNEYRPTLGVAKVSGIYEESPRVDIDGKPVTVDKRFLEILQSYSFPGNVRELKNIVGRAVILMGEDFTIRADALPDPVLAGTPEGDLSNGRKAIRNLMEYCTTVGYNKIQFLLIDQALRESDGNRTRAADLLGCHLKTVHNVLKRYIGWLNESHLDVPPYLLVSCGRWKKR
ncbi:sigma-54-dependent Fis family transcriptional regulator [Candidatus Woesearchaeota archaeon]|nr:sigma-54-dependent Fis family transcriptional regulator [Candidatus Woesearchaeota archaeon]